MQPAIELASGFEADWYTSLILGLDLDIMRFPRAAAIFLRNGAFPPRPACSCPSLTESSSVTSLTRCDGSRGGAAAFYSGELAAALAGDMRTHGGLISEDDLAGYRTRAPRADCAGHVPPSRGGGRARSTGAPLIQEVLNILEGYDLDRIDSAGVDGLHLIAECVPPAYEDFFEHVGDPERVNVPWEGLLSKAIRRPARNHHARPRQRGGTSRGGSVALQPAA